MRASDADRDIVLRTLADAYAEGRLDPVEYDERADAVTSAKTLGELPVVLDDLVPMTAPCTPWPLDTRSVEELAVAKWEKSRRDAFMGFLIPTLICWVVWGLTMFGGFPWPVFPMVGTAIPLLRHRGAAQGHHRVQQAPHRPQAGAGAASAAAQAAAPVDVGPSGYSSSSSSSSSPSLRAAATIRRTLVSEPQPSSICAVALGGELLAQVGAYLLADLLAGRVEDGQLLLGEVVVDRLGQLLDGVVERLGVGALELEHGQQRLVPLGVLLLAVLGLVLGDRVLAAQLRVDVLLLRLRVRDVQGGERVPDGVAVGRCCRAGRAAAPRSAGGRRG